MPIMLIRPLPPPAAALAASLCLLAFAAAADSPAKPLVANGGFETDADGDAWPDGWGKLKAGGSWGREEGNRFLRLSSTKPGETVLLFHPVRIPAEVKAVALHWRQRITDLKPGKQPWFDARVMIEARNGDGEKLSSPVAAPYARKSTEGWVERSVQFLLPEGTVTLELMPALLQVEAGTFDLDDVRLESTDPGPLAAEAKAAAEALAARRAKETADRQAKAAKLLADTGSLVSNGDFEIDRAGKGKKPDGNPDDWGAPKAGVSFVEENGNHFGRLDATAPDKMTMFYRTFDLPAEARALELSYRWRISGLKPGKEPWYDARIMLTFLDVAKKKVSPQPSPPNTRKDTATEGTSDQDGGGWVERRTPMLVPEGALTLEFMPALFQVKAGRLELDDVRLVPIDAAPLVAAAKARAEEERRANIPPEEPKKDRWPAELHVEGNQVLTADGKPIRLQGVNVVSLEFLVKGDHVLLSCRTAVDDWKANIIRLPVKEDYWFGRRAEQKDGGAAYRKLVDDAITMVANRGAYVLLDLHRFRAPREEHVEFWRAAAAQYKDHPAVLFDLFNEPHGISWDVWRDGGFVAEKEKPADEDAFLSEDEKKKNAAGFQSPGMQKLVDAVRDTGAKNIVLVGGLDWAYDLSGIAAGYGIDERGGNGLIYSTHIYPWKSDWKGKVLCVADKHPILVGEVGCDIKKMDFLPDSAQEDPYTWGPDMLGFMEKYGLHYTAFSFHPSASPVMINDWSYTPTPFWGEPVKRALAGEKFEMKRMR
jgi:hypothetical protein